MGLPGPVRPDHTDQLAETDLRVERLEDPRDGQPSRSHGDLARPAAAQVYVDALLPDGRSGGSIAFEALQLLLRGPGPLGELVVQGGPPLELADLGHDALVLLVVEAALLVDPLEALRPGRRVRGEAAVMRPGRAALDGHDGPRRVRQQGPVVADEQDGLP